MSSYLDSIPSAVATIVSACIAKCGDAKTPDAKDSVGKWAIDLTDKVARTLTKSLSEAVSEE